MNPRRQRIPVNLITGFLGVGKSTAIRHLLNQAPSDQRWAVLVNEFGEVGVDGVLLDDEDVLVQEVAGGCLCCVSAPAFTTGLNRLIRQHRPDRLLIEPSGLGHPAQVLQTLEGPLYRTVLDVRATMCLMDARHLHSPRHLEHPVFQDQIHLADGLIANKQDRYTPGDLSAFETFAADLKPTKKKLAVVERGMIDTEWLDLPRAGDRRAAFPEAHAFLVETMPVQPGDTEETDGDWVLIEGRSDGYNRAGWIIRQSKPWEQSRLAALLGVLETERCKGLFHTDQGWLSVNQNDWRTIKHPQDGRARLELIDVQPIDASGIDQRLRSLAINVD